ncbi:UNVERIFIED_CONTAM: hypothetical protein FKN15_070256 [Acipenser sinensis]
MLLFLVVLQSRGMDLVEILSFLFQLSFSTLGRDYSVEGMSDSLLTFLQHLREFGLVFQRKRKSRRYYPTRLAINLAAGVSGTSVDAHNQGFVIVETNYRIYAYTGQREQEVDHGLTRFIRKSRRYYPTRLAINLAAGVSGTSVDAHNQGFVIVETNYRIYAYTESELQIALVALFSELLYRFPNLIVAQVTRESVQQAIANGITAEQIIHFLRTRAHPVMLKQTPVLPPTITDQIALWELERDRLQFSEGVLYNQFLSQVDFEVLRNHAKDLGVLIWEKPQNRVMVVTQAGHSDVKKFWKRQKH